MDSRLFSHKEPMPSVIVVVPIYKTELDALEKYSLDHSLAALSGRDVVFIGPNGLDRTFYRDHYGTIDFVGFEDACFSSIPGYNRLLLSGDFYQRFADHEFMLVLQTDAIVLRDELDYWCARPFDYVGAPWPDGVDLFVNVGRFDGDNGRRVRATVGNGGFSLRRIQKCMALLAEFPEAVEVFTRTGSSEDLFFSLIGTLSANFIIPNEITASRFSLELKPSYYYCVNGGVLPMGGHAWWKYEAAFWEAFLKDCPITH